MALVASVVLLRSSMASKQTRNGCPYPPGGGVGDAEVALEREGGDAVLVPGYCSRSVGGLAKQCAPPVGSEGEPAGYGNPDPVYFVVAIWLRQSARSWRENIVGSMACGDCKGALARCAIEARGCAQPISMNTGAAGERMRDAPRHTYRRRCWHHPGTLREGQ